jgi:hypothetical protein
MPAGNRTRSWGIGWGFRRPGPVERDVEQLLAGSPESRPTKVASQIAPGLGACRASFLDQLAPRFDPVVRGVAFQGKLDSPFRDKIRPKPDLFVGWFVDGSARRRLGGSGRLWTSGFLLRRGLFLPELRCCANCFGFRSAVAASWFRPMAVSWFFCFGFGFFSHVLLSPIECPIY